MSCTTSAISSLSASTASQLETALHQQSLSFFGCPSVVGSSPGGPRPALLSPPRANLGRCLCALLSPAGFPMLVTPTNRVTGVQLQAWGPGHFLSNPVCSAARTAVESLRLSHARAHLPTRVSSEQDSDVCSSTWTKLVASHGHCKGTFLHEEVFRVPYLAASLEAHFLRRWTTSEIVKL